MLVDPMEITEFQSLSSSMRLPTVDLLRHFVRNDQIEIVYPT